MPVADKLEVRVKGPNLFPGYWKQPELTAKAFETAYGGDDQSDIASGPDGSAERALGA